MVTPKEILTTGKYLKEQDKKHLPKGVMHSSEICQASEILANWLDTYRANPYPIDVNFRNLVGPISINDLSHSVYPYPARLLRQIPRFFLHCEQLIRQSNVVLDPFCGSGTVLVEARAAGLNGWGIDKNPFARLLTKVKTTTLDKDVAVQAASEVLSRAKKNYKCVIPDVINIAFWFSPLAIQALGRLRCAILEAGLPLDLEQYLLVCLALSSEKCSFRDLNIPVPVRRHDWQVVAAEQTIDDVFQAFWIIANTFAQRLSTLPFRSDIRSVVDGEDATTAEDVYSLHLSNKIPRPHLILTSPPYGAAQKYIRSTSLSIGWTGLATAAELMPLERGLIGREHFSRRELVDFHTPNPRINEELAEVKLRNPLRAAIYAEYFRSMDSVIASLTKLLSPGGFMILVAGSNTVTGKSIHTHYYLRDIAVCYGMIPVLELRDSIRGRVLLTKRASTGIPLHYETIHVLRKEAK